MVLEHVSNGTYPLHVRNDISPGMIWYRVRAVVFAPAESVRKTDGQTPFGVYGTADASALESAQLEFGQGDDAQRSGTQLGQLKRLATQPGVIGRYSGLGLGRMAGCSPRGVY